MRISHWSSDVCSSDLVLPIDPNLALVEIDEAGDGAQQRGLAAAARPEQAEELTLPEGDRHGIERRHAAVALRRVAHVDRAHRSPPKRYSRAMISMMPMESRMMIVETALISKSEEHTSELPVTNAHIVCRLLLEKKKNK